MPVGARRKAMAGRSALCISSFANGAWGEERRQEWTGLDWRSRRRRAASTQVRLALLRSARNLRRGAAYPLRIAPRFGTRARGNKELHTMGNRKNMAIQNRLTQTLGIERPVLLAPMDLVSGGRLAAAVSHAGGLGLLAAAMATATGLTENGSARATPGSAAASSPGASLSGLRSWSALSLTGLPPSCFRLVIHGPSPQPYATLARGSSAKCRPCRRRARQWRPVRT